MGISTVSTSFPFLAPWSYSALSMSLRSFLVTIGLCGAFLCANNCSGAETRQNLDNSLSGLDTDASALTTAIQDLRDETNLSDTVLMVGNVVEASAGQTISMDITILTSTFSPVGVQGTLVVPTGFTLTSIEAGPTATAAQKQVSSSSGTFIVFGINQNVIAPGIVATAEFSIAPSIPKGPHSIGFINPVVSDANGNTIPVSAESGSVIIQ